MHWMSMERELSPFDVSIAPVDKRIWFVSLPPTELAMMVDVKVEDGIARKLLEVVLRRPERQGLHTNR